MIYVIELIKGLLIAIGIIVGMLASVAYIRHRIETNETFEDDKLVEAFEEFLQKIKDEEHYELIKEVEGIITDLKHSKSNKLIEYYRIKKDSSVILNNEEGKTILKVVTKYIIIERLTPQSA